MSPEPAVLREVALIVAVSSNGVIGDGLNIPWRLPDDLRLFKATTLGHPCLMGRRTWESLPGPLPGRGNLVLTRRHNFEAPGATVVESLQAARAFGLPDASAETSQEGTPKPLFVIGGAEVYKLALPYASILYLTQVHAQVQGDVLFPPWNPDDWRQCASIEHPADARHLHAFSTLTFTRRG